MVPAPPPLTAPQVPPDQCRRPKQRLDQARRSYQHAIRAQADGKVAILPGDETPLGQLTAALGHSSRHGVRRHRPVGASTWYTIAPPTSVSAARPVSVRPANGVLRLLESSVAGATVQRVVGSSTTTSATAPGCNVPPGRRNTVAGVVLIPAMGPRSGRGPPRPRPGGAPPHPRSRPEIPNVGPSQAGAF